MGEFLSDYLKFFQALNEAKVEYVVVGGLATVLHGYSRFTADIDLVISLENKEAENTMNCLTNYGLVPRLPVNVTDFFDPKLRKVWIEEKNMLVFPLFHPDNPMLTVDIFVEEPIPFFELSNRSELVEIDGVEIKICGINDLISMKENAGRDKDIDDIVHLREIMKLKGE